MISLSRFSSYFRIGGIAAALIGIPALSGLALGRGEGSWVIMATTFISLLVLFALFWLGCQIWKARKGAALSGMLRKNAGSADSNGIDSLHTNFELGIDKLRRANKNVYDLPWYLLAGQAGAGKTEAIRRSHAKEDFPAGLNDLTQGVGGTLNMNWWFTNKGIILDTAGRIFEERDHSGKSTEWLEFLKMLKKARKNMPINGFILAIPADSLLRDDTAAIEEKASHIAEQITVVQNTLGVRFPVFIIITKADFIPGFREFVENVSDIRLQQQMLGWSNPLGLDEPFVPEHVDAYLDGMITKLKKRRLTYMLNPRPIGKKRLDDLDASFTFPDHLKAAVPSLRRYIEIVFSLNPWSQKPLFIRGIYFTSSLQQGEALDEAVAEVMGKNLSEMALSSFKKETPLFLRDTFFEKIYRESGLVTTAGKVKGAMRRRFVFLSLAALLGVGAILAAAWFGSRSFRDGVGDQYAHWKFAADQYSEDGADRGEWARPLVFNTGLGDSFATEKNVEFTVGTETYTLSTYLLRLAEFSESKLRVPGVFKPLKFFDDFLTGNSLDREEAFRTVYEDAVILPILANSREKLRATFEENWDDRSLQGLLAQIKLQILLNREERGAGYSAAFWNELNALYTYLTGDVLELELQQAYDLFFHDSYVASEGWPSERHSELYARAEGVDIDSERSAAIAHGLDVWIKNIEKLRSRQEDQFVRLTALHSQLMEIGRFEAETIARAKEKDGFEEARLKQTQERFGDLIQGFENLSAHGSDFRFLGYYESQIKTLKERVADDISGLGNEILAMESEGGGFGEIILKRMAEERDALIRSFDTIVDPAMVERFKLADARYLDAEGGLNERLRTVEHFHVRTSELRNLNLVDWKQAIGHLERAHNLHAEAVRSLDGYEGHLKGELSVLSAMANKYLERTQRNSVEQYRRLIRSAVSPYLGFPIVADSDRVLSDEAVSHSVTFFAEVVTHIENLRTHVPEGYRNDLNQDLEILMRASRFVSSELLPAVTGGRVLVTFPSVNELLGGRRDLSGVRESVMWKARFVHLDGQGAPARMAQHRLNLGRLPMNAEGFVLVFTSALDGSLGDSGRAVFSGRWAPIRVLFDNPREIRRIDDSGFELSRRVGSGPTANLTYKLLLRFEPALPSTEGWLRSADLPGF